MMTTEHQPADIVYFKKGDGVDDAVILSDRFRRGFEIRDRNTLQIRHAKLQFPAEYEYEEFRHAVAEWMLDVAKVAPSAVVPEDWQELRDDVDLYKLWVRMTKPLFYHAPLRRKGMDIVFRHLKPYVIDGDELEGEGTLIDKSALWLRGHCSVITAMEMLESVLDIDDLVKKNANFLLTTIYQLAIPSHSTPESQKPKTLPSKTSSPRARLRSGFMFDA
jgi:hypothetical protein